MCLSPPRWRFGLVWFLALPFFCGCQQGAPTMPTMTMRLTSTAFQEGESIPKGYTGDGKSK